MRIAAPLTSCCFLLLIGGCSSSPTPQVPGDKNATGAIAATGDIKSGSLAIIMINELNDNLIHRTELTTEQARTVSLKALGALQIEKTALHLKDGYEENIEEFADDIVKGSIDALDEIGNVHQRILNKTIEEIVASVIRSMESKTSHLETAELCELLASISEIAMSHLDEAGFSVKSMAESGRVIVSSAIGTLDEAGLLNATNGREVITAIVQGAVRGLKESPLATSENRVTDFAFVLDDITYGAVGSLDDTGFETDTLDDAIEHILFASVSELDGLGFTAEDFEVLIEAEIQGALDGLKREAGISDPAQIEDAYGFCVKGAVAGLAETSLILADMVAASSEIVENSIEHIDNLGIGKDQTEAVAEQIVERALDAFLAAGLHKDKTEAFSGVMVGMAVGAAKGLADVGLSIEETKDAMDSIILGFFSALKTYSLTKEQCMEIGDLFRVDLKADLAKESALGITYDDDTIGEHVDSAITKCFPG